MLNCTYIATSNKFFNSSYQINGPTKTGPTEPVPMCLEQIATQTILTVSSTEKCTLQHTKSLKESLVGKDPKNS